MTTSSFRRTIQFWAAICLVLVLLTPTVRAENAAADQAQIETQDAKPAPQKVAVPGVESDEADDEADVPAVAPDAQAAPEAVPGVDDIKTKTEKAIEKVITKKDDVKPATAADAAKLQKAPLGSLKMRQSAVRLDRISLWRADDKSAPTDVWDGTEAPDVQAILPALVMAHNPHVKDIILRIAMSGVYIPAGMTDMEYINWRANVLMAQKHPELAARLLNVARLGRDSGTDAVHRAGYELAAGAIEAACVESMAAGDDKTAFWQGMAVICAQHLGDQNTVKTLVAALPDGAIKTAAAAGKPDDLKDATIKASGIIPVSKAIPDNQEILARLAQLISDINNADGSLSAVADNKGQLLLLSLGALRAEHRGEDTGKVTDQALHLAWVDAPITAPPANPAKP